MGGACANQDLKGFAAALEESPLSICVNAGVWNSYTGGVMSSAACGPMGAAYQDHCVMAVGFNTTASTPYWNGKLSKAGTKNNTRMLQMKTHAISYSRPSSKM